MVRCLFISSFFLFSHFTYSLILTKHQIFSLWMRPRRKSPTLLAWVVRAFISSLSLIDIGGYALRIDTLDGRCLWQSFTFDCLCLYLPCRFSIYFCYSPTKQTKLPVVWTPTISSSFSILSFSTFFPHSKSAVFVLKISLLSTF